MPVRVSLLITAADSDAGGLQVVATDGTGAFLHGQYGLDTEAFLAKPDAQGRELPFALGFVADGGDVAGGILVREQSPDFDESVKKALPRSCLMCASAE